MSVMPRSALPTLRALLESSHRPRHDRHPAQPPPHAGNELCAVSESRSRPPGHDRDG
jgi:hypothetical protein